MAAKSDENHGDGVFQTVVPRNPAISQHLLRSVAYRLSRLDMVDNRFADRNLPAVGHYSDLVVAFYVRSDLARCQKH